MASIRKYQGARGVRYQAQVRKAGQPPLSKTFSTKKSAQDWAREMERDADLGHALPGAEARRRTVKYLLDHVMKTDTGRDRSRGERMLWWNEQIGHLKLAEVNKGVIANALHELETAKSERTGKMRRTSTVNRYLTTISGALQEAVRRDWIPENPARKVARRKEDSTRHRYLNDEERPRLLAACRDEQAPPWLYPMVLMALGTGARRGELLELRWRDVDLKRERAHVRHTKTDQPRTLVLLAPVIEALKEWGAVRDLHDDRVFPLANTHRLDRPWRLACERAELDEHLRFHDLRHSCASYLAQNGANLPTIMTALGHTSLAAAQRYQHLLMDHVAEAMAEAMEGFQPSRAHPPRWRPLSSGLILCQLSIMSGRALRLRDADAVAGSRVR
jgi:integrase